MTVEQESLPSGLTCLSACSVPRSKHPRPSDARSPSRNPLSRLCEVRTPAPRRAWVPFHRFPPVAEGVGRGGTPVGQACTADSGTNQKKTEPNTMFNKVILIGRLG